MQPKWHQNKSPPAHKRSIHIMLSMLWRKHIQFIQNNRRWVERQRTWIYYAVKVYGRTLGNVYRLVFLLCVRSQNSFHMAFFFQSKDLKPRRNCESFSFFDSHRTREEETLCLSSRLELQNTNTGEANVIENSECQRFRENILWLEAGVSCVSGAA